MATEPIRWPDKSPPVRPALTFVDMRVRGHGWDLRREPGVVAMWVWVPRRIRKYVCSAGVEHTAYWRTIWRQGREDYVACQEHEVV